MSTKILQSELFARLNESNESSISKQDDWLYDGCTKERVFVSGQMYST